jgi:predicted metal-dependent hydrolase
VPSLEVGGRRIEYVVSKGASRRYTYFRFTADRLLEVVMPRAGTVDVEKAIRENLPWIFREQERAAKSTAVLGKVSLMLGGIILKLVFLQSSKEELAIDFQRLEARVFASNRERTRELVRRLFLKESSAYATRKVAELAPRLAVRPTRVDVREIKNWGYCTWSGRLSFSWQLAALPERLSEYVVLHELIHLAEFSHSPAFKRKLGAACPDHRQREKELNLILPYNGLGPPM